MENKDEIIALQNEIMHGLMNQRMRLIGPRKPPPSRRKKQRKQRRRPRSAPPPRRKRLRKPSRN